MFADKRAARGAARNSKKIDAFSKSSDHFVFPLYLINGHGALLSYDSHPPSTMAIETASSSAPSLPSVFETLAQRPRPQDVGILGIEMYFPQRVRHCYPSFPLFLTAFLIPLSASPRRTLRFMTALRRANTPLASARSLWRSRMIGRTSTQWPSLARRTFSFNSYSHLTFFRLH
jgi:hypothetical protein